MLIIAELKGKMRQAILFLLNRILILLLCFVCGAPIYTQTALDELNVGKERLQNGDCKKAIINFQNALKLNPNSIEAKLGYAECSKNMGSYNDSKRAYTEVLSRSAKNFEAVIGLSEINILLMEENLIPPRIDPLLEEFPNHTGLRILQSKYLQAIGKKDLAIHKLVTLSEKLNHPADVEKMLAELYLKNNKWKEAEDSLSRYISQTPSDPTGFYLLAKLALYKNYFNVPNLLNQLQEAEGNIQNALNLDSKHEPSRLLLVYLKMMEAYRSRDLNQEPLEKGFRLIYELAREFPENKHYHSLEASIGEELNRKEFSEYHYRRALQIDDLDEIGRFEAEEFALKHLKEESKMRRELGGYRKERYLAEKHSLYFKSAKFHLLRSRDLTPFNVRNELIDMYDLTGDSIRFINLLIKFREEDPTNFKLQNKLEFAIHTLKQSLEYREGLFQIAPKGIVYDPISFSPEVFVFDLESRVPFPEHYPGGRLIAKALRYELKHVFNVRLPDDKEFLTIRNGIKETNFHPFTKTIPFSVESLHHLDSARLNKTKIRYVLHGNYKFENDLIEVEISLYDRETSKDIGVWKTSQKGRDSLPTIASRIAEKVKLILPINGKILKIRESDVLISLGKIDGLNLKSSVQFTRKGNVLMEGEILELGNEISLIRPKMRGWEKELATGDSVSIKPMADTSVKSK
ncbi:tetratricopeptide repeat protein [Leptospira ognonensis]|uniref:tetratricopeptide repeat protein n=1 Tax=Leptospira ognonensis TaxID=2484945 RepID=UPI0014383F75|nr:tetratricopeptide repeat protein [Leptospira ognonensis]